MQVAARKAGIALQPAFDTLTNRWVSAREIEPLRRDVAQAIGARDSHRTLAARLQRQYRAEGIQRDARRVARTEIAEASGRGTWEVDVGAGDPLLYRRTQRVACRECVRLLTTAEGKPRLYRKSEVEAGDAMGYNTGSHSDWHVRIGVLHPNCCCPSWTEYIPELEELWKNDVAKILAARVAVGIDK